MKIVISLIIMCTLLACAPVQPQIYNPQPVYAGIISDIESDLRTAVTTEETVRLETALVEVKLRQAEALERQGVRQNIQSRQPTIFDQVFNVAMTTAIIGVVTKVIFR